MQIQLERIVGLAQIKKLYDSLTIGFTTIRIMSVLRIRLLPHQLRLI